MTDPLRGPKKGSSGGRSRFTWRSLFESLHPRREGTMPAGLILVVIVLAFVVAGILNADATLRKSNAKGESWRNDIAQTVASVTDTFRLNFLRTFTEAARH